MRDELDIPVPASGPSYRVARQRNGMDASTKRLAVIAGGIGGALALFIGGYSLSGMRGGGGIPVIQAPSGPIRVKPDKPGGLEVFGGDDSILSGTQDGKAEVAPAPESPDPLGLKAQEAREHIDAAPSVGAPDAAPPVIAQMQPQPASAQPASKQSAATASKLTAVAPAVPAAVSGVAPGAVANVAPAAAAPPTSSARVETPAAKSAAVATAGGMQVQLAALASEQAATAEWSRLAKKFPELFAGKQPAISHFDRDGKTYYRLRTGGFSDTAQATEFCQQMREKGAACSIASF